MKKIFGVCVCCDRVKKWWGKVESKSVVYIFGSHCRVEHVPLCVGTIVDAHVNQSLHYQEFKSHIK